MVPAVYIRHNCFWLVSHHSGLQVHCRTLDPRVWCSIPSKALEWLQLLFFSPKIKPNFRQITAVTVTCNTRRVAEVMVEIFHCWKQLNPIYTVPFWIQQLLIVATIVDTREKPCFQLTGSCTYRMHLL